MPADIVYSILGAPDFDETAELLTEEFCRHDPVEIALHITPAEFRVMLELELVPLVRNGLCVVARETASGRLVGAMLAMDALAEPVDGQGRVSEKFAPISDIARHFHDGYLRNRDIQPGSCLYLFMIGVRSGMTGNGLGKTLFREVLQNAKNRGYRSSFAITTNLASTRALESHGFRILEMLDYPTYRYQGRPVFASISAHPGIALMELESLTDTPVKKADKAS